MEEEVAIAKSRNECKQRQGAIESAAMRLRVSRSPGRPSFGSSPSRTDTVLLHSLSPGKLSMELSAGSDAQLGISAGQSGIRASVSAHPLLLAGAIGYASHEASKASYRNLRSAPVHLQLAHQPQDIPPESAAGFLYPSPETSHMHRRVLGVPCIDEFDAACEGDTLTASPQAAPAARMPGRRRNATASSERSTPATTNWVWGGVGHGEYGHKR